MTDAVLDNDGAGHADRVAAWLARAEALHDRALSKQESARLRFEQGRLAELTGDAATAAARYRQAYATFPHPEIDAGPPSAASVSCRDDRRPLAGFGWRTGHHRDSEWLAAAVVPLRPSSIGRNPKALARRALPG